MGNELWGGSDLHDHELNVRTAQSSVNGAAGADGDGVERPSSRSPWPAITGADNRAPAVEPFHVYSPVPPRSETRESLTAVEDTAVLAAVQFR